jgi:hypothetical protein
LAEPRVLRSTNGQLVHVGLADDDGAGCLKVTHNRRVLQGGNRIEQSGASGAGQPCDVYQVLNDERQPAEWAGRNRAVDCERAGTGVLRINVSDGAKASIVTRDSRERSLHCLRCAYLTHLSPAHSCF